MSADRRLGQISLLTKAALALSIGLLGFLVAWTNVVAYTINFQFVQHVLSMDALASWAQVETLTSRAVTDPQVQQIVYGVIILGEFIVGLLASVGGLILLLCVFTRDSQHLATGKAFALAGCGVGILVWYLGFAVIATEYFAMWASAWNGQTTAYMFSGFLLLSMVYIAQPEPRQG